MGSDQLARADAEEAEEALLIYGQAAIGELESGPDPTAYLGLRSVINNFCLRTISSGMKLFHNVHIPKTPQLRLSLLLLALQLNETL